MANPPKLELRKVHKWFGEFCAVDNVELSITTGECCAFLGPSGCGKTTTLRMIAGFVQPDKGSIWIDGRQVAGEGIFLPPNKRGISMVFQSYAVWPHKTVYENVAYGLRIRRVRGKELRNRVLDALARVQLSGLADRYPAMLSGGQQQRVALARAIVIEPTILLLDEPLSNLDARLREEMRFDLKELQKQLGLTAIYVTHDQAEAMVIADSIMVMEAGKIVQVGPPEEIYDQPKTRFVANFIGESNILPAEIIDMEGSSGHLSVNIAGAGVLPLPGSSELDRPAQGQKGFLCVRPEDVSLKLVGDGPGDQGGWRGEVLSKTYLGSVVDYRVRVGEHEMRASLHRTNRFRSGDEILVQVRAETCAWLPG